MGGKKKKGVKTYIYKNKIFQSLKILLKKRALVLKNWREGGEGREREKKKKKQPRELFFLLKTREKRDGESKREIELKIV